MMHEALKTIIVVRAASGRRYTGLPVDMIDREGFVIECADAYLKPDQYDLRVGDIVRWQEGERYAEATIAAVDRDANVLRASLAQATLLPPDFFPY